jgi:predicted RND superfamily exporter protein
MKRFASYLIRRQWLVVLVLVGVTIGALCGIARLEIDPSNARLLPRQGKDYRVYQRFLATFGSDEDILVALHDPQRQILAPEGLAAVRHLTQALAAIPHVASVHSLTNAPDMAQLTLTPFGIAVPPLIADATLSLEQIEAIRHNEQVLGTLLATDLHTAGILVVPEADMAARTREAWIAAVRAVAAQHAGHERQTYVAGTPIERSDVTHYIQRDQQLIIPLVVLVLLCVTYGIYRVKRFALLSLACVLLSLTWTMGVIGFVGIPLNVITSLLPAVIMVVSVSVVIHLINQFIDEAEAGISGAVAVENAVSHVGPACFLTSLTNAMGFFSLPVIQAPAIQEFGCFAGLGVLLAFVATMTFAPIALLWMGRIAPTRLRHLKEGRLESLLDRLTWWVSVHRRMVFAGMGLVLLVMVPGIWRITEGTDIVRALKKDAPLRVSSEFIDRHLTGVHSLELLVQIPNGDGTTSPAAIRRVLEFSRWLRAQPGVTAVLSPWEPLRGVRQNLLEDDDRLKVLATLLPLGSPMAAWLDASGRAIRLSARVAAIDSERFLDLAQHAVQQAERAALQVQVTGSNYLLSEMSRVLVHSQISSLLLAVVTILGTITLALRSWKMGLVAAIPNLLPTLMIFGLMGWCGIELSTATTMIASVALGLFVDDTIHLLYLYTHEKKAGRDTFGAIEQSLHHAGRAVIFTSLILTLGFWTGLFGSFKPTLYFSFLMGLTMLFSVVAELLVTPATVLALEGNPACGMRSTERGTPKSPQ